jgi:hypothetical protein
MWRVIHRTDIAWCSTGCIFILLPCTLLSSYPTLQDLQAAPLNLHTLSRSCTYTYTAETLL